MHGFNAARFSIAKPRMPSRTSHRNARPWTWWTWCNHAKQILQNGRGGGISKSVLLATHVDSDSLILFTVCAVTYERSPIRLVNAMLGVLLEELHLQPREAVVSQRSGEECNFPGSFLWFDHSDQEGRLA